MRDRPGGSDLLRLAHAALLDELLDALPRDRRYEARLVANAMAIAAHEQDAGKGPLLAEYEALAELFDEAAEPKESGAEALEEALARLNWRLAAEIRGGRRDGAVQVHALLQATTRARLRESNPKALEQEGAAEASPGGPRSGQ